MPQVSELSLLPVSRIAPAATDYVICELRAQSPGGQPVAALVPIANLPSGSGGLVIGTSPITGGSSNHLLYNNAGVLGDLPLGVGLSITGGTLINTGELTIGSSPISGGTTNRLIFDNAGVVGELILGTNLSISGGNTLNATGGITGSGVSGQVAYWNGASSLTGDAGLTYTSQGQLTVALGTITANAKALNITGTWNAAGVVFDAPLFVNVTNTASAALSMVADFQIGGNTQFSVGFLTAGANPTIWAGSVVPSASNFFASYSSNIWQFNNPNSAGFQWFANNSTNMATLNTTHFSLPAATYLDWNTDVSFARRAAAIVSVQQPLSLGTACSFQVYNTVDSVSGATTNYERGVLDWTTTANVLTIGTQAGGTGGLRNINMRYAGQLNYINDALGAATLTFVDNSTFWQWYSNGGGRGLAWQAASGFYFQYAVAGSGVAYLNIPANANFQFGQPDSATPVAQTLSVQNVVAGTANTAGANMTERASLSTGSGGAGLWNVNTGFTGSAGASTFTVTIASPAVFTDTAHGFFGGQPILLSTTGALPTGLSTLTTYYVDSATLAANTFEVSTSYGGAVVNTSGSQSGTHTATPGGTCTISNASPAVITATNHGLVPGMVVQFQTTGALPTGLSTSTNYFVLSAGLTVSAFEVSATLNGSAINTSSAGSGTQTYQVQGGTTQNPAYTLATWGPSQLTGAQTTSALSLTQVWNTSGNADAALKINVTNANSSANSLLTDFRVNGVTFFSVAPSGNIQTGDPGAGNNTGTGIIFGTATGYIGPFQIGRGNGAILVYPGLGSSKFSFAQTSGQVGELIASANTFIGFSSSTDANNANSTDTALARRAAGVLSLQNASSLTTATGFQVFNTVDTITGSVTNYERGIFDWTTNANVLTIGTQKGGTGSTRNMQFVIGNALQMDFGISVAGQWAVQNNFYVGAAANSLIATGGNQWAVGNTGLLGNGNASFPSGGGITWSANSAAYTSPDTSVVRVAPKVISVGDGAANVNGWMQWAGESRNTASQNFTSTTTFAAVTGLTVNVIAGRTYHFQAHIPVTAGGNAGGIKVNVAGTATATAILYDVWAVSSNAITGQAQAAALGAANAGSVLGAATGFVFVDGIITVNAAGTLIIQAAQNTSNATSTTIGQGASWFVDDTP